MPCTCQSAVDLFYGALAAFRCFFKMRARFVALLHPSRSWGWAGCLCLSHRDLDTAPLAGALFLLVHRFHTCERGEGFLTGWTHFLNKIALFLRIIRVFHQQNTANIKNEDGTAENVNFGGLQFPANFASYREAWHVSANSSTPDAPLLGDKFSSGGFGNGTKGTLTIYGEASYLDGITLPASFVQTSGPAGDLQWTSRGDTGLPTTTSVIRSVTATWDCSCNSKNKKTTLNIQR